MTTDTLPSPIDCREDEGLSSGSASSGLGQVSSCLTRDWVRLIRSSRVEIAPCWRPKFRTKQPQVRRSWSQSGNVTADLSGMR